MADVKRQLLLLSLCFVCANAYSTFQNEIPNGELVPHPCKPNFLWKGVGHLNVLGGGARNPFGKDFSRLGKKWNRELCEMDSDGDGISNGEELGDPDCIWTPQGGAPAKVAKGHPGVCEPVNSLMCRAKNAAVKADWEFCEEGEYKCDAIKEPDVLNFTIAIDMETPVPAEETTYMCQLVKLPDDKQYHIIGTKPALDNKVVAHHIIVHGCDETALEKIGHYSTPQPCESMLVNDACKNHFGGWTVGLPGLCELKDVGKRFGKRVFNYAVIEIHWNNPLKVATYTDGSGLTIFYTPKLRKYDSSNFNIGQRSLAIPPNAETHCQTAYCRKECTKNLEQPVNIYSLNLHMHYLGRGGQVGHWRNGSLAQVLVAEESYSYDSPKRYEFNPPILFMPGDELKMFCKFKSTTTDQFTYYGDATSDEMCFSFLNYFPYSPQLSACINLGPTNVCRKGVMGFEEVLYDSLKRMGCMMGSYETVITEVITEAAVICGYRNPVCNDECMEYFQAVYKKQPCLRNGIRFIFERLMLKEPTNNTDTNLRLLRVCDKGMIKANTVVKYYDMEYVSGTSCMTSDMTSGMAVIAVVAAITLFKLF